MCLTCNPYCGRCHPPSKRRAVACLDCGRENTFDDGDVTRSVCSFCGGRLPEMRTQPTVRCRYSGLLCSQPCGRVRERTSDGAHHPCDRRVPPLDWREFSKKLRKGPVRVEEKEGGRS